MIFEYSNYYSPQLNVRIIQLDELMYMGGEALLKPHKIDFYALIFVKEGTLIINIDEKQIVIKEGEAFFTGPGQVYFFEEFKGVKSKVVSFTEEFWLSNAQENSVIEKFKLLLEFSQLHILRTDISNVESINYLLQALYIESRNRFDRLQASILQNILTAILYLFERTSHHYGTQIDNIGDKYYKLAWNYKLLLTKNIKEHSSLSYYLDKLNVSQSTLQMATKVIYQRSPKAILDETLIFCAKRMLADSSKRIQEIGDELGFSEATNFSKYFKKHTGVTPENFRGALSADL